MVKRSLAAATLLLVAGAVAAQAEDFFFDSGGVRIHYTLEGKGEPVVLIHGFASSIESNWVAPGIVRSLVRNYQVIAIDNRGHGRSDKPHDPKMYGENLVLDVVRLLDRLKIPSAHIVGYSMGGRIASSLLADHPDRVRTATLGGAPWAAAGSMRARIVFANRVAESLEQGKGVGPLIAVLTPRGSRPPSAETVAAINRAILQNNDPLALAAAIRGNVTLNPSAASLRALKTPVLAIFGERDPVRAELERMTAALRNVKVVMIPKANHLNAFRTPEFLSALEAFLKENDTR